MLLCRDNLHGLLSAFFGADGRGQLSKEAFRAFVLELRDELLRLEFEWYDWRRQGAISGRDFAHSIVSCARLKHVDAYLDKCQVGGGVDVGVGGVGGWGGWGWWWGWWWWGGDEGGVWRGAWWWLVSEGGWVAGRRVTLVELAPILSPPPPPLLDAPTLRLSRQAMPAELAGLRVSFEEFRQFRDVWRQLRLLSGAAGWVGLRVAGGGRQLRCGCMKRTQGRVLKEPHPLHTARRGCCQAQSL